MRVPPPAAAHSVRRVFLPLVHAKHGSAMTGEEKWNFSFSLPPPGRGRAGVGVCSDAAMTTAYGCLTLRVTPRHDIGWSDPEGQTPVVGAAATWKASSARRRYSMTM